MSTGLSAAASQPRRNHRYPGRPRAAFEGQCFASGTRLSDCLSSTESAFPSITRSTKGPVLLTGICVGQEASSCSCWCRNSCSACALPARLPPQAARCGAAVREKRWAHPDDRLPWENSSIHRQSNSCQQLRCHAEPTTPLALTPAGSWQHPWQRPPGRRRGRRVRGRAEVPGAAEGAGLAAFPCCRSAWLWTARRLLPLCAAPAQRSLLRPASAAPKRDTSPAAHNQAAGGDTRSPLAVGGESPCLPARRLGWAATNGY